MRVAVTGGTGFLGRQIIEELLADQHEVRCLVRVGSQIDELKQKQIPFVIGDLDDAKSLRHLLEGCQAVVHAAVWSDGPLHMAGQNDMTQHFEKNVLGSLRLLQLAREQDVQYIFLSSGSVYGNPPGDEVLIEDFPRSPDSPYGAYKMAIEGFIQGYGQGLNCNACALRPVSILGVRDPIDQSPHYSMIRQLVAGQTVQVSKGQKVVMVKDVARAVSFMLGRSDVRGQIYNLCDGWVRQQDLAQIAGMITLSAGKIVAVARPSAQHDISSDKIKFLGFRFSGLEGLRAYVRELVRFAEKSAADAATTAVPVSK